MPRGKSRPVKIGELEFKTTGAAIKHVQKIIAQYPGGGVVRPIDLGFFSDVLALHPRSTQKIESGVKSFEIRRNPKYTNTMSVYVVRNDDSKTEFSWRKCIEGEAEGELQKEALRKAVAYQIIGFRDEQFFSGQLLVCPVTGERITEDNYHIDHVAPNTFDNLVADWLGSEGFSLEAVEISPSIDNQSGREMANPQQITSWTRFHSQHARLRILSQRGNLTLPKPKFNIS